MKKFFSLALAVLMLGTTAMAQINTAAKRIPAEKMMWVKSDVNQTAVNLTQKAVKNTGSQEAIRANSPINQFPYEEGFENGTTDWTFVDNDNDGFNWATFTTDPHGGATCISSASYDNPSYTALTPDNWMISQEIQLPAGSTFELSWYDAAQDANYPADHYAVYIATTNTVAGFTATTAVYETTLSANVWAKRTVDLTSYAGQNVYVAFRHYNCTDQFVMKIDDIRIGTPGAPDITVAGDLAGFVNETLSFTATCSDTAATINWTLQSATPATATGTAVDAVWATAGTFIVKASATNANGTASDSIAVAILDCTGVQAVPFTESFENGLGCWSVLDVDADGTTWEIGEGAGYDGTSCVYTTYGDANDNWLISPQITIPNDGSAYLLSWYSMIQSSYYPETYEVLVSTTGSANTTNFTSVFSETLNETNWVKRTVSLANYAGQTINIAFRNTSLDMFRQYVDYVKVSAPEVPNNLVISGPTTLQVNQSGTYTATCDDATATYAWTIDGEASTETSDTLTASFATAGAHTIVATATNSVGSISETLNVTVISCEAITTYPYTMGFEAGEDITCWTFVDADGDGYNWTSDVQYEAYEGVGLISSASYMNEISSALTPDNWMITPALEIPAGSNYDLSWMVAAQDASYSDENYAVYVSTTGMNTTDFTTTLYDGTSTGEWTMQVANLGAYAGQTIYIAFRHYNTTDMFWLNIDNIRIGEALAPIVTLQGPTQAISGQMVTFTAVSGNATSYAWTVDGQAASETSNTLTTSFTTAGTHSVSVTATNSTGSTTETATIEIIVWGDQMYYDNGVFVDCIGTGSGVYWGVRFDASALTNRNFLTSVDLYVNEVGTYTLNVYQDGDNAPGNLIYTQTDQCAMAGDWYTYTFSPVALDVTKDLWITFYCDDVAYPAAGCDYTGVPDGTYVSMDGIDWTYLFEAAPTLNYTWMIRATTSNGIGTNETLVNGTGIYPNPTTGMLHINAQDVQEIQVIDLNGSVVMSQTEGTSVNISNLSSGIYMVRIITENGVAMHKVVKE